MIIYIKGSSTDIFKDSNIGTLSTWSISRVLGEGASYNGVTYVNKDAALSATVTIAEGYSIGSAGVTVTMGGVTQSGVTTVSEDSMTVTISISSVTGNVVIKVPTINDSTGEEDSGSSTETTNLLTLGTLTENAVTTSTSDTTLMTSDVYFTYSNIPVSANTTYISPYGRRTFYLDSSYGIISQENIYNLSPQWVFTTPANCAYVIISYKYEDIAVSDTTLTLYTV